MERGPCGGADAVGLPSPSSGHCPGPVAAVSQVPPARPTGTPASFHLGAWCFLEASPSFILPSLLRCPLPMEAVPASTSTAAHTPGASRLPSPLPALLSPEHLLPPNLLRVPFGYSLFIWLLLVSCTTECQLLGAEACPWCIPGSDGCVATTEHPASIC